jgi:hypothetical protein
MKTLDVSDDDLIDLNIGGQKLTTTRSTLCQVEGSLLASMFSGRWEDGMKRDKDGAVFFDFNFQYFVLILDYLRARKIMSPDNPPPFPIVPKDQLKTFTTLVEYLGLSDEIVLTHEVLAGEKFNPHSTIFGLQEGGKVAARDGTAGRGYVLGETVYKQGIAKLKLRLESFQSNRWMFVGMVKDDAVTSIPKDGFSCEWPGSYGWTLGAAGGDVRTDGHRQPVDNLNNLSKQGDTVELILDCEIGKLSLHLPTGQKFHVEIPESKSWRLNVTFLYPNDKIRIMES